MGVVRVHLVREAGRDSGERGARAGNELIGLAGERQRPFFARNRIAGQDDHRGARGHRIHCRHARGDDRERGLERILAAAEDQQAGGAAIGRVQARRVRIDLGREFGQDRLQAGRRGRLDAVARRDPIDRQREHPGFACDHARAGHVQARRRRRGFAADGRRGLRDRVARAQGRGEVAIDDEELRPVGRRRERRRIRIGRVVDQRGERRRHLRGVIGCQRGVADRRRAARQRQAVDVAGAHRAADGRVFGRRRGSLGQGPCRRHGKGRGQRRAGTIDDEQLIAFGKRRDIRWGLRVNGRRQAGHDLGQGRAGGSDHVAGLGRDRADGHIDGPDLAGHRGAARRRRVGVGRARRDGAAGRDRARDARAAVLDERVDRREGAGAVDDDQHAAVADGAEGGKRRQRALVDEVRERLRDGLAPLADRHRMGEADPGHRDAVDIADDRRAAQGGEGGARRRGPRGRAPRLRGRRRRGEAGVDRRRRRARDDDARALRRRAESVGACGNRLGERLRDLGERIHDHQAVAEVDRGADDDRVVDERIARRRAGAHRPRIARDRRAAQVDQVGSARRGGAEAGRRGHCDRRRRTEGAGRVLDEEQARALRRRGESAQARVAAHRGRQRFGDLGQRIHDDRVDRRADHHADRGSTDADRPGFAGLRRARQREGVRLHCRRGRRRRRGTGRRTDAVVTKPPALRLTMSSTAPSVRAVKSVASAFV